MWDELFMFPNNGFKNGCSFFFTSKSPGRANITLLSTCDKADLYPQCYYSGHWQLIKQVCEHLNMWQPDICRIGHVPFTLIIKATEASDEN